MKFQILSISVLILFFVFIVMSFLFLWSVHYGIKPQKISFPKEIYQDTEPSISIKALLPKSTDYEINGWPDGKLSNSSFKERFLKILEYETRNIDSEWSSLKAAPVIGYFSNYMLKIDSTAELKFASTITTRTNIEAIIIFNSNSNLPVHIFDYAGHNLKADYQACQSYKDKGCNYPNKLTLDFSKFIEGNYYAQILTSEGGLSSPIFFGLRNEWSNINKRKDVLIVYPSYTWQAYNNIGGASFYSKKADRLFQVSLDRPLNSSILMDYHNARSSLPFSKQLQDAGYSVINATDNDLNINPELLKKVKLVIFTGHAEYWTAEVRNALDEYVSNGGRIAAFSGNTGWWQVKEEKNNIYKSGNRTQAEGIYKETGRGFNTWIDNRISNLMGQTYMYGGYSLSSKINADKFKSYFLDKEDIVFSRGIEVIENDHPIFKNTGLKPFDRFGGNSDIVFLELDGLPLRGDGKLDLGEYPFFPDELKILARTLVIDANTPPSKYTPKGRVKSIAIISEITHPNGGKVLHLGSIGWYRALVTKNKISRKVFLNSVEYLTGKAPSINTNNKQAMIEIDLPSKLAYVPLKKFINQRKKFTDLSLQDKLIFIDQILMKNFPSSESFVEFIPYIAKGLDNKNILAERISIQTVGKNRLSFNAAFSGKSKIKDLFEKTEPITSDLLLQSYKELNGTPMLNKTIKALLQYWAFWVNGELSEKSCDIFLKVSDKDYLPGDILFKECNAQVLYLAAEKKNLALKIKKEREYIKNSYTIFLKKKLRSFAIRYVAWFEAVTGLEFKPKKAA